MIHSLWEKVFKGKAFQISILITVVVIVFYWINPSFLELVELKAYDARLRSRGPIPTENKVAIIAIDEKSLASEELGRWVWSRDKFARLINTLKDYGVRSIGMDVIFAEPEESQKEQAFVEVAEKISELGLSAPKLTSFLKEESERVDPDRLLADSIRNAESVVLGNFFFEQAEEISHVKLEEVNPEFQCQDSSRYPVINYISEKDIKYWIPEALYIQNSVEIITQAALASGYFNMKPDPDGVMRSIPMLFRYKDCILPPLSIQVLRYYMDNPLLMAKIAEYGVERIQLGDIEIPTDEVGRMFINYRGPQKTFPHYSAIDVIRGDIPEGDLKDKIVLVGATATGIYDLRVTPFESVFPGVEVHANIIDNMLQGDFIIHPGWASIFDISLMGFLGILFGIALPKVKATPGAVGSAVLLVAYIYMNRYLLIHRGTWLNVVYPSLQILFMYTGIILFRYLSEEREKKKIKGAFQFYVTPSVVNEMLRHPEKLKLGGDRKDLTVLFSDIRGFTTISESLAPEGLVTLLNEYLTKMTDVVFNYDGTLDKYIGDAIMAIYGAPLEDDDHPAKACFSAIDMMEELRGLQKNWESQDMPFIDIGIGINTGPMVAGNMGSQTRFDYTVMGDSVNLGSRLEGINKEYGTHIIISEFTYQYINDRIICRQLDSVRVKGKRHPIKIFELIGRIDVYDGDLERIQIFEEGLNLYLDKRWNQAIQAFEAVLGIEPNDTPSKIYIQRCTDYSKSPPPEDWDGVYTMIKK
jgi:adenylate cyclase